MNKYCNKKYLMHGLKILVSAVLLYVIILKIDWDQFSSSIFQGDRLKLIIALFIGLSFNIVKFYKWKYLIVNDNFKYSFWDGAKSYMIGNSLGIATPMRAGDLGRALYFPIGDRSRIMGLTIMDRVLDLVAVLVLAIGGSFLVINKMFGAAILLSAILLILILQMPAKIHNKLKKNTYEFVLKEKILKIFEVFGDIKASKINICILLSLSSFILILAEFYFLVNAFEPIRFSVIALVTPIIIISNIIPISIMGLGVREGLAILLLSFYGVMDSTSFSAAFLLFFFNNATISIVGIVFILRIRVFEKAITEST